MRGCGFYACQGYLFGITTVRSNPQYIFIRICWLWFLCLPRISLWDHDRWVNPQYILYEFRYLFLK